MWMIWFLGGLAVFQVYLYTTTTSLEKHLSEVAPMRIFASIISPRSVDALVHLEGFWDSSFMHFLRRNAIQFSKLTLFAHNVATPW